MSPLKIENQSPKSEDENLRLRILQLDAQLKVSDASNEKLNVELADANAEIVLLNAKLAKFENERPKLIAHSPTPKKKPSSGIRFGQIIPPGSA